MPDLRQNPIDLIIADHCSHFDETACLRGEEAGLAIELLSTRSASEGTGCRGFPSRRWSRACGDVRRRRAAGMVRRSDACSISTLLDEVRRAARTLAVEKRPFGIMGSSIAACWTMLELDGKVDFFVDEDPHRIGHELPGLPILGPAQVPAGAVVFIPMSVAVAEKIIHRWQHLPMIFATSPRIVRFSRPPGFTVRRPIRGSLASGSA